MNNFIANSEVATSEQPPLNCFAHLQRFKGYYRFVSLSPKIDRYQQAYWLIQLSDMHQCISAYYFCEPRALNGLKPGDILQCEISIKRHKKSRYLHLAYVEKASVSLCIKKTDVQSLPCALSPDNSSLQAFYSLVDSINNKNLKSCIAEVLIPGSVCIAFLQAPANLSNHHSYPGGLLAHLIEVASILAHIPWQGNTLRDLAITAALLKDIGTVKTLESNINSPIPKTSSSELTIDICSNALATLEQQDEKSASLLRRILTCETWSVQNGNPKEYTLACATQIAGILYAEVTKGNLTK